MVINVYVLIVLLLTTFLFSLISFLTVGIPMFVCGHFYKLADTINDFMMAHAGKIIGVMWLLLFVGSLVITF